MSSKIKGLTIEIGGETTLLTKALGEVNKKTRDLKTELRDVERLLKLDPGNTELIAQKQQILTESINKTKEKLEQLKEAEKQAQQQFKEGKIGEEQYRAIQREVIKTEEELKKMNTRLKEMDWKTVTDNLDKFGTKSIDVGKKLSKNVTTPIIGIGIAATTMASQFTDAMAKVSTLADENVVSMKDLEKGILDISNATGKAATEITESVYDALSSGIETGDVLGFVASNTMLAKAGFTDMGTAVDITTTILNAYGDKAFDVATIGDMLVKTQDKGKITVGELGESMGKVIPTASALGVNLDQLGASYAILTSKGQNANIATTNLNGLLAELGKTGSKSDEALRKMAGKGFKELIDEGKSVGDVLSLLEGYAKDSEISLSDMFGSATAGRAALSLISDGAEGFNEVLGELQNSTGAVEENFEKLLTPSENLKIALNKIKNEGIQLGEILLPIVEKIANAIEGIVAKFASLTDGQREIIVIIAALVAAIGPLLIIVGKMSLGVSAIIKLFATLGPAIANTGGIAGIASTAMGGLTTAFAALTGPIGIAIAAVVAIGVAIVALWKTNDEFRENVTKVWEQIKEIYDKTMKAIKKIVTDIYNEIMKFWEKNSENIKKITKTIWDAIANTFNTVLKLIKGYLDVFIGLFTGDWTRMAEGAKTIFSTLWENIKNIVAGAWNLLSGVFGILKDNITGWFTGLISNSFNWGKNLIGGFVDGIKSMVGAVGSAVSNVVDNVKDFIGFNSPTKKGEGRYIIDWGYNMIDGFIEGMNKALPELESSLKMAIPSMGSANSPTLSTSNSFVVHATIREEGDISKIAKELYGLQQRSNRGRGLSV